MVHKMSTNEQQAYLTQMDDLKRQAHECCAMLHKKDLDMEDLIEALLSLQYDARELANGVALDLEV